MNIESALSKLSALRAGGRTAESQRAGYALLKSIVPKKRLGSARNMSIKNIRKILINPAEIPAPDVKKAVRRTSKFTPAKRLYIKGAAPVQYIYMLTYKMKGDPVTHLGTKINAREVIKRFKKQFSKRSGNMLLYGDNQERMMASTVKVESREILDEKRRSQLVEEFNNRKK